MIFLFCTILILGYFPLSVLRLKAKEIILSVKAMKSVPRIISRLKYLDFWQSSKNSWKLWHVFVMSTKRRHRRPANQTYKFPVKFSRIFRWRKALSSKLFQGFHVAKCDSELNNEALLSKIFALNFFFVSYVSILVITMLLFNFSFCLFGVHSI